MIDDRALPDGAGRVLHRGGPKRQGDLVGRSGGLRSVYRVAFDANPAHIPQVISRLITRSAGTLPDMQRLRLRGALHELLFNAVEHGTLELGFREKQRAMAAGRYEAILRQRMTEPRFRGRLVTIEVCHERNITCVTYRIADEGNGFQWRRFLAGSQDICGSKDLNGRGIFLAQSLFPTLTYNDRGNEVTITVSLG
ncbi:MAG TPA: ATP-binding protein [Nitrospira sp.]|nr:ATP-binding protein [Nitrospira sp.]